ncbi:MAG TPA: hypothetical protein VIM84_11305 [Gemmatimonadales bacterium]
MDTQPSPLDTNGIGSIQEMTATAHLSLYRNDPQQTLLTLSRIGQTWGYQGEYVVALACAMEINAQAPSDHRDAHGAPLLIRATSLTAPPLLRFAHLLMDREPIPTSDPPQDVHTALAANVSLVENYVHTLRDGSAETAYEMWEHMYAVMDGLHEPTPEEMWRAVACSALLLWWAAVYCVVPTTS